jgi:hypothetical protein
MHIFLQNCAVLCEFMQNCTIATRTGIFILNLCCKAVRMAYPAGIEPATIGFANNLRRPLVIAHGDEGAMPQMPGIGPFDVGDLANQLRFDPAALLHFLCR